MESADHYEQLTTEAVDEAQDYVVNNQWDVATYQLQRAAIFAQLAVAAANSAK